VRFNKLTDAQGERLALLLEELGESQQAIGKILRHGYDSRHPDGGPTNREQLARELGHVLTAVDILVSNDDLSDDLVLEERHEKHESVRPYLHHTHHAHRRMFGEEVPDA
jgi:NTP pyrophosphatase (non-canonical NTP hydrolase)